jgi:hypothetical protein
MRARKLVHANNLTVWRSSRKSPIIVFWQPFKFGPVFSRGSLENETARLLAKAALVIHNAKRIEVFAEGKEDVIRVVYFRTETSSFSDGNKLTEV